MKKYVFFVSIIVIFFIFNSINSFALSCESLGGRCLSSCPAGYCEVPSLTPSCNEEETNVSSVIVDKTGYSCRFNCYIGSCETYGSCKSGEGTCPSGSSCCMGSCLIKTRKPSKPLNYS